MGKCLITKLNGSVNNSELLKIGELRISFGKVQNPTKENRSLNIKVNKESKVELIGDGYFTDENLGANKGKSLLLSPNTNNYIYISNNDVAISISDKYALTGIFHQAVEYPWNASGDKSHIKYNLEDLKYSAALTNLSAKSANISGDISALTNLTALVTMDLSNAQVSGDIANLKTLTALTSMNLSNAQVSGDIANLKTLTALTSMDLSNAQVSGDIANLKTLTALTSMNLSNTQISGDIANLKTLTALTSMNLSSTNISGNISALANLTALTSMNLSNMQNPLTGNISNLKSLTKCTDIKLDYSKLTGDLATLPASCRFVSFYKDKGSTFTWTTRSSSAKIIAIASTATLTNIDKMLQDQAQCQVGFSSSNDVWLKTISVTGKRTSASDDAVATLQQKGYTISIAKA